jgi:hypothetical protein
MTAAGVHRDRDARHCYAVSCDDRVTAGSARPVVLRNGAGIEDRLGVTSAMADCSIIVIFAHLLVGSVSVGLNAVALVNAR